MWNGVQPTPYEYGRRPSGLCQDYSSVRRDLWKEWNNEDLWRKCKTIWESNDMLTNITPPCFPQIRIKQWKHKQFLNSFHSPRWRSSLPYQQPLKGSKWILSRKKRNLEIFTKKLLEKLYSSTISFWGRNLVFIFIF